MKWLKYSAWALLGLVTTSFVTLATWEPFFAHREKAPQDNRSYEAEIIRNEFGVPHIYGKTDPDVAFGIAVAQSEDDFFTLQDVIAMSRGRYGAIAGEAGAAIDYVYHLIDARGTADRHYEGLPSDTRALFDGYAAGLNQYAKNNPNELKLANLFPVNGKDIAAGFALRQPFFFGLNSIIQPLVEGSELRREFGPDIPGFPRNDAGVVVTTSPEEVADQTYSFPLPWGETAALSGSNAFAVAPKRSDGPTVLISNSHQPLTGGVAWYEMTVESEEGWHFTGANFPGSPFPFLGHNRHLGWTNTVNRPDMVDIYELEIDNEGLSYNLDGEWLRLERKTVILPVKIGPIVLPIPRTIHRSRHGPVVLNRNGAFAFRYGGMDSVEQLDAYYKLNKSTNFSEWENQIARLVIPSTNFIYADEDGNIAYVYNAAIPNRPIEAGVNWRGVLPGNRSDLIWQGTVDYAQIPKLINPSSGWLYNANNEPYTAAGVEDDILRESVSPILGVELKQTNRSRRAWRLLSEAESLDRDNLKRIKYDTTYELEGYVKDLWNALNNMTFNDDIANDDPLRLARNLLLGWDFTADSEGPADALALLIIRDFMSAEYGNRPLPDIATQLEAATNHLIEHFGRLDPPMSELLRLRHGSVDLPLDGGSDTLRASTTWKVDGDGRLRLVHGDSFIQWVEWRHGEPVRSQSIQPFGAAISRPESPHHTDQMELFVNHQLKTVLFWRDDVIANAKQRYIVESN